MPLSDSAPGICWHSGSPSPNTPLAVSVQPVRPLLHPILRTAIQHWPEGLLYSLVALRTFSLQLGCFRPTAASLSKVLRVENTPHQEFPPSRMGLGLGIWPNLNCADLDHRGRTAHLTRGLEDASCVDLVTRRAVPWCMLENLGKL